MHGKNQCENASHAGLAHHLDVAAHLARKGATDREAGTSAAIAAAGRVIDLNEPLENAREIRVVNSHAGVRNVDGNGLAVRARRDGYSTGRRELRRIGEQVQEDLPQLVRVCAADDSLIHEHGLYEEAAS